tara:strand:- start:18 stop:674 length:657 start_codon:yes stop_codon:yes gene_type:complete
MPQEVLKNNTSSLTEFYDNIVYWEIAKNTNKFFVTFEKGQYAIPNNRQESIGTMEIDYPKVLSNTASSDNFIDGVTRNTARFDAFLEGEEKISTSSGVADSHNYNGFITTTGLKGTRFFQSTLTSSIFQSTTIDYEISDTVASFSSSREVKASYFYPYSSHQLSVLRKNPTLIIDLDKSNELPNGVGDKGFVLIPEHTHPAIKDNLDYWLKRAGYETK